MVDEDKYAKEDAEELSKLQRAVMIVVGHKEKIRRTRFQKTIFLTSRLFGFEEELDPDPYRFGVFSEDLVEAALNLEDQGMLNIEERRYTLTEYGKKVFKYIAKQDLEFAEKLVGFIDSTNHISDDDIVAIQYALFPEYTTKSIIKHKVRTDKVMIKRVKSLKKGEKKVVDFDDLHIEIICE